VILRVFRLIRKAKYFWQKSGENGEKILRMLRFKRRRGFETSPTLNDLLLKATKEAPSVFYPNSHFLAILLFFFQKNLDNIGRVLHLPHNYSTTFTHTSV
jgi:hypothetical protein